MNLYLFHTSGCHLCELAEIELSALPQTFKFELIHCDIVESDSWMQCYDVRIPVLKLEGCEQDLGWPFNTKDIANYLTGQNVIIS